MAGYHYYDENGNPIKMYGVKPGSVKVHSATSQEFRDKGDIALNVSMTYKRKKAPKEGEVWTKATGYEWHTRPVNVVPGGASTQSIKNNLVREQSERSVILHKAGRDEEANMAFTQSVNLNNAMLTNELDNFHRSAQPITTVTTGAYTDSGYQSTQIVVKKLKGGAFEASYGNEAVKEQFEDLNQLNSWIQTTTGAIKKE